MASSSLFRVDCVWDDILRAVATNAPYWGETKPIETVNLGERAGHINPLEVLFLADRLATAMLTNTSVKTVDLSGRLLQASAAESLETILKKHPTLTFLNLNGNQLGVAGAQAIARGLVENQTLTELHLNDLTLGAEGLEALQEALEHNQTLRVLTLPPLQEFIKSVKDPDPRPAIERIEAAYVRIRLENVLRESYHEEGTLTQEEMWHRKQVTHVYSSLPHHVRSNVEFQVWKQFECPKGDLEFGKKHVFTSWSIFLASIKAAKVNMGDAIEKYYKGPQALSPGEAQEIRTWAAATFR